MGPFCPLYSFPPEPGLYWYHPHAHTLAEAQMLGGATGALVVGGIQNYQPAVVGLPERLIVVRDNLLPAGSPPPELPSCPTCFDGVPSWDVTVSTLWGCVIFLWRADLLLFVLTNLSLALRTR